MRSGTEMSQFLRIFLPSFVCVVGASSWFRGCDSLVRLSFVWRDVNDAILHLELQSNPSNASSLLEGLPAMHLNLSNTLVNVPCSYGGQTECPCAVLVPNCGYLK